MDEVPDTRPSLLVCLRDPKDDRAWTESVSGGDPPSSGFNRWSAQSQLLSYLEQTVVTATSRHPGGVNVMTGDGSVRFVKASVSAGVWTALGTIAGGEVVDANAY
jgi:prepilin-type processing-associated H-X9-DG protein